MCSGSHAASDRTVFLDSRIRLYFAEEQLVRLYRENAGNKRSIQRGGIPRNARQRKPRDLSNPSLVLVRLSD